MLASWLSLMDTLGFGENRSEYQKLNELYSSAGRYYHTMQHLADCLEKHRLYTQYVDVPAISSQPLEGIALALWFHDAIYQPFSKVNEERSAAMARAFLEKNNADPGFTAMVEGLILATKNHAADHHKWEVCLMLDIDLSILGASPEGFALYEQNIRKEYRLVPAALYRRKRKLVLQGFLNMPQIFRSPWFHENYEKQARANIEAILVAPEI